MCIVKGTHGTYIFQRLKHHGKYVLLPKSFAFDILIEAAMVYYSEKAQTAYHKPIEGHGVLLWYDLRRLTGQYLDIYYHCDTLSANTEIVDRFTVDHIHRFFLPTIHGGQFNTFRPRQNGRHFADDIFNCIFLSENVWIPIEISLKFVPKGPIYNIPALV